MNKPAAQPDQLTEVMKANAAIHVDSRQLTLTHRKAFNILLLHAWDEIDQNKLHVINASTLAHLLGYHDIADLYVALKKLPGILVHWNLRRDDGWPIDSGACGLLAGFRMVGNNFRYSFFEDFRPHLKNPKLWTKIKIEVANLFNSGYALALYETCNRYAKAGSSGFIKVDEWRELIGIPTTPYYRTFGVVLKKIINPAIKQVNELSDITIEPAFKRSGRGGAISELKFTVTKKVDYKLPDRQLLLPIKKEHVAREVASYKPAEDVEVKNPGVLYLEAQRAKRGVQQTQPKPLFVRFQAPPPDEVRAMLKAEGFKWLPDDAAWFNPAVTSALANKIFQAVVPVHGVAQYGLSKDCQ